MKTVIEVDFSKPLPPKKIEWLDDILKGTGLSSKTKSLRIYWNSEGKNKRIVELHGFLRDKIILNDKFRKYALPIALHIRNRQMNTSKYFMRGMASVFLQKELTTEYGWLKEQWYDIPKKERDEIWKEKYEKYVKNLHEPTEQTWHNYICKTMRPETITKWAVAMQRINLNLGIPNPPEFVTEGYL